MKPAPFDYRAPERLDDAISLLAASPNAKVIAGGQSLIPMLNFRLVTPDLLVDIARIPELKGIQAKGRGLAHLAIRNKGTIGGKPLPCRSGRGVAAAGRVVGRPGPVGGSRRGSYPRGPQFFAGCVDGRSGEQRNPRQCQYSRAAWEHGPCL